MDCDVLIAGAGPAGLLLAIELARRGIHCRIVDAAICPFDGSRGKGLQPRTLEIFDHIGIASNVAAQAMHYPRMRIHAGPISFRIGSLGSDYPATPLLPWPNLLMLRQADTERILREKLAELGVQPEFGKALVSFRQSGTSVEVEIASGELVRARYLVGCDGGRSTVRKALDIPLIGESLDNKESVVADVEIPDLDWSEWHNWLTWKGVIAVSPLPGCDLFQIQAPASIDVDEQLGGFARATGFSVKKIAWKSRFRHQSRMAETYRRGRVLLAGDAAHIHPPSGGQGLNTSIQDSWNLGWKLAAVLAGAPDALLDTYVEERMGVAAAMLKLTKQLHKTSSAKRGSKTNQLSLGYPDSGLSQGSAVHGVMPGQRMPNLLLNDGRHVFDLLKSPKVLRLQDGSGSQILVRPDGYVGVTGPFEGSLLAALPFESAELVG